MAVLERLGNYCIVREIGRGGMGVVYEAEQVSLKRRVALKVLPPSLLRDVGRKKRFLREAQSAAKLHPTNIVPVFGVGVDQGLHYYVMQFIEGSSLDHVLDEIVNELQNDHGPGSNGRQLRSNPLQTASAKPSEAMINTAVGRLSDTLAISDSIATLRGQTDFDDPRLNYSECVARIGVQAAEALDHAYEQGILHRDIKPSNLILDSQ